MNAKDHITEPELIARLKQKDRAALEYLYDRYSAALNGMIVRIVHHQATAEEILQDVFLKVWDRIHLYEGNKGKLFTWLLTIARHQAIDKLRSREIRNDRKTTMLQNTVSIGDEAFAETHIESIGVSEILTQLTEEQRFVVEYLYFKGYTQSELAKEFDIPLGTVKTRLRMALKQLRKILGFA